MICLATSLSCANRMVYTGPSPPSECDDVFDAAVLPSNDNHDDASRSSSAQTDVWTDSLWLLASSELGFAALEPPTPRVDGADSVFAARGSDTKGETKSSRVSECEGECGCECEGVER